jgi:hypothetical protein
MQARGGRHRERLSSVQIKIQGLGIAFGMSLVSSTNGNTNRSSDT